MASSPSNKEEMTQVVVYTRGIWSQNWDDDGNELDSVYTEHNGETITEHRFSMPLNFTCALLHEHVTSAIGIMSEYDMDILFKQHVTEQLALGKPIKVYHTAYK
ncbi:hypothetical protein E3N88_08289 [Mikania micrantha]|uniref:Uncharacterized protein n=1 Tax=Mikania micrantha TaxID=192012 RepID=A0A5N6PFV6_9ASTR|nr:hypothetical protein E3N88_08289 [Mikania micrantha]